VLSFLADENLNAAIVRGLLRQRSDLDIVSVAEAGLSGANDRAVLEWASAHGRILVTHDFKTIPRYALERVRDGQHLPGVFEVPADAPMGRVIDDILLLAECSFEDEWVNQVLYLPL
jgi:hypothetical protein